MRAAHCAWNAPLALAQICRAILYLIDIRSRRSGRIVSLAIGYPITFQSVLSANGIEDRRDKLTIKSTLAGSCGRARARARARERIKARKPISAPRPASCLLINESVFYS